MIDSLAAHKPASEINQMKLYVALLVVAVMACDGGSVRSETFV